jgi:hypothetical protein
MEKNSSCIGFGSVEQAWDYMKIIVCELVNGAKPFQLASPMQWNHAICVAKVPRHLHHVENIWSFLLGITL